MADECIKDGMEAVYADITGWIEKPSIRNDYFLDNTKKFLESMLYIAKINVNCIKDNKNMVDKNISSIKNFLKSKKSINEDVRSMFGFTDGSLEFKNINKHYYYYIADVKLKACIYLLRIHRFIIKFDKDIDFISNGLEKFKDEIKNIYIDDIERIICSKKDNKNRIKYLLYLDKNSRKIKFNEVKEEDEKNNEDKVTIENLVNSKYETYADKKEIDKLSKYINYIYLLCQKIDDKKANDTFISSRVQAEQIHILNSGEIIENDYLSELLKISGEIDSLVMINEVNDESSESINEEKIINFTSRIKEINYWQKISKEKTEWKKYMIDYYLFDNSMKEIHFTGIGWKYRWRWLSDHTDLFRGVGTDAFKWNWTEQESERNLGKIYMENMFHNIINHMNKGNDKPKLSSYSKDPYRDIYKYLIIEPVENQNWQINWKINIENEEIEDSNKANGKVSLILNNNVVNIANDKTVFFAMIKEGSVNIIRKLNKCMNNEKGLFTIKNTTGQSDKCTVYKACGTLKENPPKSFYKFISDIKQNQDKNADIEVKDIENKKIDLSEYGFSVDILNNSASYSGDVRSVFQEYMDQWAYGKIKGVQRNIVSTKDKEVVVLGNVANDIKGYDGKETKGYDECEKNTEYRVNLNKEELIYLYVLLNKRLNKKEEITFNIHVLVQQIKNLLAESDELSDENTSCEEEKTHTIEVSVNDVKVNIELEEKAFRLLKGENNIENVIKDLLKKLLYRFEKEQDDIVKNKINFILSFVLRHKVSETSFEGKYKSGDIEVLFWKYMLLG